MKLRHMLRRARPAAAGLLAFLLGSCVLFPAKEVALTERSAQESQDYYRFSAGGANELSFESRNFLSSNLLMEDFHSNGEKLIRRLAIRQTREPSRPLLSVLSDVCFQLAHQSSDPGTALKYDLAAVYYASELLFNEKYRNSSLGQYDPSMFQAARIYNGALARLYAALSRRELLHKGQYRLETANGREVIFDLPSYDLIYPAQSYREFRLCSDFRISNLSHFTYEFGLGVPVIAISNQETRYQHLHTAAPIAHGATAFLRFFKSEADGKIHARMEFYDNDRVRAIRVDDQRVPLIFDYSTPLAYYISTLPDVNLLDYMMNPGAPQYRQGLFTLEPYHPHKIPVVLVHGLMSSIHTWMEMVNTLKNDPHIRKHCQFWFYTYSSGNPIIYSAWQLRKSLNDARAELATTPEARASFDRMVIIGHSMGGLISKTLIQDPGDLLIRRTTGHSWEKIEPVCTPEQRELIENIALFKSVPFVRRILFLAVPHRGSILAHYSQVRLIARFITLPSKLVRTLNDVTTNFLRKQNQVGKALRGIPTGLEGLDPNDKVLRALNEIPLKADVPYHSIIGNRDQDMPGGTDGIVSYSSAHLDQAKSELVVQSGHSIQQHPMAIYEVRRILRQHLKEEKLCQDGDTGSSERSGAPVIAPGKP